MVIGVQNSIKSTEKTEFKTIHYLSEDTIEVLSKKGVPDQICAEWAMSNNNESSAHWSNLRYVVSQYLPQMIPQRVGYALYIDGTQVYNDSSRISREEGRTLTHSSRVLTGYKSGLPVRGYVAKVSLNSIAGKEASSYTYFGGFVGEEEHRQRFVLPDDAQPTAAYMELNVGTNFSLYVNGQYCGAFIPSGFECLPM